MSMTSHLRMLPLAVLLAFCVLTLAACTASGGMKPSVPGATAPSAAAPGTGAQSAGAPAQSPAQPPAQPPTQTPAQPPVQPPAQTPAWSETARAELKAGHYQEAATLLEQAAAADPTRADVWNDLAFAYIRLQDWVRAAAAGETAMRLRPDDPAVRFNLGRAYLGAKRYGEASTQLAIAYEKNSQNTDVIWYLGQAYEGEQRLTYALQMYQQGSALQPQDENFRQGVLRVQAALASSDTLLLKADLTGDGRAEQVWAREGRLRVVGADGYEWLRLEQDWVRRYSAEAVDLGDGPPVLWVRTEPGCPAGPEHGLYRYVAGKTGMAELLWFGCATAADFDTVARTVSFAQRAMPAYVTYTYRINRAGVTRISETASLVSGFVWPGNLDQALAIALQADPDGGKDLFTNPSVGAAFLADWSGRESKVTLTDQVMSQDEKSMTARIAVTGSDGRRAVGQVTAVETENGWKISSLILTR